jgi:hypothetical protein
MHQINKLLPKNKVLTKFVSKGETFVHQTMTNLFWLGFLPNSYSSSFYLCNTHCMIIMDLINKFPKIKFTQWTSPKKEPLLTKLWPTFFGLDSCQMPTLVHSIYVVLIVWLWIKLTSYFLKIKFKLSSSPKEKPLLTWLGLLPNAYSSSFYLCSTHCMIMDLINKLLP